MDSLTVQTGVQRPKVYSASLRMLSFAVLVGILVAGLWPFHSPRNDVAWTGQGLSLGKYGIVLSAERFRVDESNGASPCTLELWLEPARVDKSGTIFAYYQPDHRFAQISLGQYKAGLVFERGDLNHQLQRFAGVYAGELLRVHNTVLVSITSGGSGTTLYADGRLVKRSPGFKFSGKDLAGQLIFGNAPATTNLWSGTLRGFAVYDTELSPDEVHQHYMSWVRNDEKALAKTTGAVALYPFDENRGTIVHNRVDPATNLTIPDRFFVPHKPFLEPAWDEFYPNWSYCRNVILNVAGFVPLGFVFCALLHSASDVRRPILATTALGFAVSLTIEVLQGFLPTRSSGTTDLFTNTLGTASGAIAYVSPLVRRYMEKLRWHALLPEEITK
jgi:hypothetical protein